MASEKIEDIAERLTLAYPIMDERASDPLFKAGYMNAITDFAAALLEQERLEGRGNVG